LKFSDNGVGIPKTVIDKIFEPFVSTKEDGTGLGLFISYSIIENHQGTIDVSSKVGEGATFTVRLPITPIASHT
jgi:signal transduction histidine kinase